MKKWMMTFGIALIATFVGYGIHDIVGQISPKSNNSPKLDNRMDIIIQNEDSPESFPGFRLVDQLTGDIWFMTPNLDIFYVGNLHTIRSNADNIKPTFQELKRGADSLYYAHLSDPPR